MEPTDHPPPDPGAEIPGTEAPGHGTEPEALVAWSDRWLLPVLLVGVVLNLAISGVLIWGAFKVNDNANKASAAASKAQQAASAAHISQATQYQTCVTGNESRSEQLDLWRYTASLIASSGVEDQKFAQSILNQATVTFAPRNCQPLKS